MKHTQIQKSHIEDFITIGEYIQQNQPNIFQKLYRKFRLYIKDVTEQILAAADVSCEDKYYQNIMQERPKRGKGGLLPGEKEVNL